MKSTLKVPMKMRKPKVCRVRSQILAGPLSTWLSGFFWAEFPGNFMRVESIHHKLQLLPCNDIPQVFPYKTRSERKIFCRTSDANNSASMR